MVYKKGSPKSEMVKQIQKALHLYPDGIFGIMTEEAVIEFQKNNNLKADGIVGPATLVKLIPFRLKKSKRVITELIVHCSATPEGKPCSVEQIRKEHIKQGWSDIGYHYVIDLEGNMYLGRDVDIVGAHCAKGGHNQHSIGICYVGGLENKPGVAYNKLKAKDTRTEKQKAALLALLIDLKKLYPNAKIYGHHDFEPHKECPSFDAKSEYRRL